MSQKESELDFLLSEIQTHCNKDGDLFYSVKREDGKILCSFNMSFEDSWIMEEGQSFEDVPSKA